MGSYRVNVLCAKIFKEFRRLSYLRRWTHEKEHNWKNMMASATLPVDWSYATWNAASICIPSSADVFHTAAAAAAENAMKTINVPVISRAEQLPALTWQSTRSVILVCCCLLTSVTALGICHTMAALIFPCVRLLTPAVGSRDDPWRPRDGQVPAGFLKWQLQFFFLSYCFQQQICV